MSYAYYSVVARESSDHVHRDGVVHVEQPSGVSAISKHERLLIAKLIYYYLPLQKNYCRAQGNRSRGPSRWEKKGQTPGIL